MGLCKTVGTRPFHLAGGGGRHESALVRGGTGAAFGRVGTDPGEAPGLVALGVKNTRIFIGYFALFTSHLTTDSGMILGS